MSKHIVTDTRWAVVAKVDAATLERLARKYVPASNPWKVLAGSDGFHALVVGRGAPDDRVAAAVAKAAAAYLLDFNDEAWAIVEHHRNKTRHKRGHPAAFMKARGMTPPGHEPSPPSPVRFVHVIEGATVQQVKNAYTNPSLKISRHPRGTIAIGDVFSNVRKWVDLGAGLVFQLAHSTETGRFWCDVLRPNEYRRERFMTQPMPNPESYRAVDNILGATTPLDICRVLAVPLDALGIRPPGEDADPGGQ